MQVSLINRVKEIRLKNQSRGGFVGLEIQLKLFDTRHNFIKLNDSLSSVGEIPQRARQNFV